MAALVLLALALFAATSDASRVVGGWPTTVERYPGIVQVEFLYEGLWQQMCGASILNNRYVLSAAHCYGDDLDPSLHRIRAGSTTRHIGGVVVFIEKAINHPSFFTPGKGYDGDISILRLASDLVYSAVIQPVTIIAQDVQLPDGLPVQYVGWGHTVESGESSDDLLETTVYTVNREVCIVNYHVVFEGLLPITENMFCAGLINVGGRDGCQGDSGGPVFYNDPTSGQDFLVGVVSFGHGCGRPEYPGVNTAVSSYSDWIAETAV